jgi:AcrR family transcriptional regulator
MSSQKSYQDVAPPANDAHQPKRTQEQRRSDAEARLLEAAKQIVAHKGWVGMTLGDVGIAAGYSRGLATHYFGSKPELLRALAAHIGENFKTMVSEAPNRGNGFHAVLEFIRIYFGRADDDWISTRALLILMAEGTTEGTEAGANLAIYNETVMGILEGYFQEAITKREVREDFDPAAAAVALLGTVRGVMLQSLLKNSKIDLAKVAAEVMSTTIRAYSRRPQTWLALYTERARA